MIIVFGASGGIGSGLLECAVRDGIPVFGAFRSDCDVRFDDSVSSFFSNSNRLGDPSEPLYVVNAIGHLDNAMIHSSIVGKVAETIASNLMGSYRVARHFRNAAANRPGSSLLLLSSVVARTGVAGAAAYGMCKAGISGLVRSACKEFARCDLRVNAIEMGYFDTGMIGRIPGDKLASIQRSIPLNRFGTVAELWSLCSSVLTNSYMTGQIVGITGGL